MLKILSVSIVRQFYNNFPRAGRAGDILTAPTFLLLVLWWTAPKPSIRAAYPLHCVEYQLASVIYAPGLTDGKRLAGIIQNQNIRTYEHPKIIIIIITTTTIIIIIVIIIIIIIVIIIISWSLKSTSTSGCFNHCPLWVLRPPLDSPSQWPVGKARARLPEFQ